MTKKKIIKLDEKEQRDLFCAAWHLTNLIEDCKEGKIVSFTTSCETCKYQKECLKNDNFDAYTHFQTLTKLTGVIVTPLKGARTNSFNLFNEELIEDLNLEIDKKRTAQEVPVQEQSVVSIPSIILKLTPQQCEELEKNLLSGQQKLQTDQC